MTKVLLLGAGSSRKLHVQAPERGEVELVTLDMEACHEPDVVWDLEDRPLPFDDGEFDEVHAYEVLEHIGKQGDWRGFFEEFHEYHRLLRPGGYLCLSFPHWRSPWAWGDPGHTRCLSLESLIFLNREAYEQVGKSPMTDYRSVLECDFRVRWDQVSYADGSPSRQWVALEAVHG